MAALMAALAGAVVGPASVEALAQGTASPARGRPITVIVPDAAGAVTDTGARLMAAGLEKELATAVVVANTPGAASQVGLMELLRSKPDGYVHRSCFPP
jgi:tripartite-type tricarboxylate transporter receptor subunit TctC